MSSGVVCMSQGLLSQSACVYPSNQITLVRPVGGGSTCMRCFQGEVDGELVFVKGIFDKTMFQRELQILQHLGGHPNIVKMKAIGEEDGEAKLLILELMESNLAEFIVSPEYEQLSIQRRVEIALNIANALQCVHEKSLIYRDIKLENVLVSKQGREVKLADFGLSCVLAKNQYLRDRQQPKGNALYMAPEVMKLAPFDEKADIFGYTHNQHFFLFCRYIRTKQIQVWDTTVGDSDWYKVVPTGRLLYSEVVLQLHL